MYLPHRRFSVEIGDRKVSRRSNRIIPQGDCEHDLTLIYARLCKSTTLLLAVASNRVNRADITAKQLRSMTRPQHPKPLPPLPASTGPIKVSPSSSTEKPVVALPQTQAFPDYQW